MKVNFIIGSRMQSVDICPKRLLGILQPAEQLEASAEEDIIRNALDAPYGKPRLSELVSLGEKVAIITSDGTRPTPTSKMIPLVLDELYASGIHQEDITLYFALGSHRVQTEAEQKHLAGDRAWSEIKCVDFDPNCCTYVGTTSRGTPVFADERVVSADRRICLGNVEYHYFAGYSGGAKALVPGICSRETIQANHKHMLEAGACAGVLKGNPVREDIEEAAGLIGIDFILNVVLNTQKKIVYAAAGDAAKAHREGCRYIDDLYRIAIREKADIVIASQGGAPKDINLYQTQKALDNAKYAVKDGGIVILVGSCREGFGEGRFERWLLEAGKPSDLIHRLNNNFELGGHKAAAIAQTIEKADIYLVSDMDAQLVEKAFMKPFSTVEAAYRAAIKKLGENVTVFAMPCAGSVLPWLEKF